ncbi:hypothetical protein F2Q69_00048491 [Brassica cretica]|uniref:Uncharacterized protein n=1 Tax=Brassica cretica TaxID=69181 RepID=A0A8S9Q1X4_BRACR|nr:hypothetical protein F2Q69_00048491 [Brassica cretica]
MCRLLKTRIIDVSAYVDNLGVKETFPKFLKLEDPTDLPDPIFAVVGKTFTFGISVEKEHVLYGSEIYKVGKIYKDRRIVFTEKDNLENSHSDQDLALTSGGEENTSKECPHHPQRERKHGLPAPEITSTSKNLRSKAIKVEKMSDLEAEASKNT